MAESLPDVNVAWAKEAVFMQGFESALIGLTCDGLAIYDFDKAAGVIVAQNQYLDISDATDILAYQVMPELAGKVLFVSVENHEEPGGEA